MIFDDNWSKLYILGLDRDGHFQHFRITTIKLKWVKKCSYLWIMQPFKLKKYIIRNWEKNSCFYFRLFWEKMQIKFHVGQNIKILMINFEKNSFFFGVQSTVLVLMMEPYLWFECIIYSIPSLSHLSLCCVINGFRCVRDSEREGIWGAMVS